VHTPPLLEELLELAPPVLLEPLLDDEVPGPHAARTPVKHTKRKETLDMPCLS
jgi:hypothetical protein